MGKVVIASAIIWAAVIIATKVIVPEAMGELIPILGGGAAAHIVILGAMARKR